MMKNLKKVCGVRVGGDFNDENLLKRLRSAPGIVWRGEEEYLGRRVGGRE